MSVNKLERLLNLTAVLLDTRRPLTAEELRQKVEGYPPPGTAFHRTFERDKDDLRVLGIPLLVEKVAATDPPVDGYRIAAEDYYLTDPGLEPDELAALHLASLTVRMEGMGEQEALWKLGGLDADTSAPANPATESAADAPGLASGALASLPADPALEPFFSAIASAQVVSFDYRSRSGEVATRTIEPWRLDFHRGRWYLTGWDRSRDDERNFRLDRVVGSVDFTGDRVAHPAPTTSAAGPRRPWELGGDEPTLATLLVDRSHADNALRQLGPESVSETRADGSVVFTVPVVRFESFRSFVLGFLGHAELLGPDHWRKDLMAWLGRIESEAGES
jgi:proteasome accessory factor B